MVLDSEMGQRLQVVKTTREAATSLAARYRPSRLPVAELHTRALRAEDSHAGSSPDEHRIFVRGTPSVVGDALALQASNRAVDARRSPSLGGRGPHEPEPPPTLETRRAEEEAAGLR